MDNVFVGANTTILYGVRIGQNCIIGADSLINKDLEPNAVYAGIPVKKICSFDEFVARRKRSATASVKVSQHLTREEAMIAWDVFDNCHGK